MSHSVARWLLVFFLMTCSPACSTTHKQSLSKDVRPLMALCARGPIFLQSHLAEVASSGIRFFLMTLACKGTPSRA